MKLTFHPYQLQFRFPFRISHGWRTATDAVFVKLEHEGLIAWGEATLPPYLEESVKTVTEFLSLPEVQHINFPVYPPEVLHSFHRQYSGNMTAKAALDMALWNLYAQTENKTIGELLGVKSETYPVCTYTIGISSFEEMKIKVADAEANGFQMYKLKLNGAEDEVMIKSFRKLSDKPFAVDVNQGWKNAEEALRKMEWLEKQGCVLVEQPLPVQNPEEMRIIKPLSALPVYADESCKVYSDLEYVSELYHGVNIKLMKCGGLSPAMEMIQYAKDAGLKILIGCMSESSVGCTAAAHLTPLADYADLDGPYLIANDPFDGMKVDAGRIGIHPLVQKHLIES